MFDEGEVDAIDELERCRGSQFDPWVVDAFMRLMRRVDPEELVRTIEEEVQLASVGGVGEGELGLVSKSALVSGVGEEASVGAEVGGSGALK